MGHATTRPGDRLRPSRARLVLLWPSGRRRRKQAPSWLTVSSTATPSAYGARDTVRVMRPGGEHVNATLIREGYATAIWTFP